MTKLTLAGAITSAVEILSKVAGENGDVVVRQDAKLEDIEKIAAARNLHLDQIMATASLGLAKNRLMLPERERRDKMRFFISDLRPEAELLYTAKSTVSWALNPERIRRAVIATNLKIELVHDLSIANDVQIFETLGLRNLSSFMGETFAREIRIVEAGRFMANLNQDGYPDLCAMTPEGKKYFDLRVAQGETSVKEYWSPFPHGGVEVKGTCGNTPAAKKIAKPTIGESRFPILSSAEWKAHHRETNNLAAIYWDFIDGLPTVLAVFYRNDLVEEDWGKIVQPKEGGGKTTSVSIMTRPGVEKMALGWVVLPNDPKILPKLRQKRVFPISDAQFASGCTEFAQKLRAQSKDN
jgi:hypothetical protein